MEVVPKIDYESLFPTLFVAIISILKFSMFLTIVSPSLTGAATTILASSDAHAMSMSFGTGFVERTDITGILPPVTLTVVKKSLIGDLTSCML